MLCTHISVAAFTKGTVCYFLTLLNQLIFGLVYTAIVPQASRGQEFAVWGSSLRETAWGTPVPLWMLVYPFTLQLAPKNLPTVGFFPCRHSHSYAMGQSHRCRSNHSVTPPEHSRLSSTATERIVRSVSVWKLLSSTKGNIIYLCLHFFCLKSENWQDNGSKASQRLPAAVTSVLQSLCVSWVDKFALESNLLMPLSLACPLTSQQLGLSTSN